MLRQALNKLMGESPDPRALVAEARIEAARSELEMVQGEIPELEDRHRRARVELMAAHEAALAARRISRGLVASRELQEAMKGRITAQGAYARAEAALNRARNRIRDAGLALKRAESGLPDPPAPVVIGGPGIVRGRPDEKGEMRPAQEAARYTFVQQPVELERMVRVKLSNGSTVRLSEAEARSRGLHG